MTWLNFIVFSVKTATPNIGGVDVRVQRHVLPQSCREKTHLYGAKVKERDIREKYSAHTLLAINCILKT